jgi:hypothetical protein
MSQAREDALLTLLRDGGMPSLAAIRRFRLLAPWDFDSGDWIRRVAFDGAALDAGTAVPSDDDDLPAVSVYGSDSEGWEIDAETDPSETIYPTAALALEAADAILAVTWTLGSDGIGQGDLVSYDSSSWGPVQGRVLVLTPVDLLVQDDHPHGAREWWPRHLCQKVTP